LNPGGWHRLLFLDQGLQSSFDFAGARTRLAVCGNVQQWPAVQPDDIRPALSQRNPSRYQAEQKRERACRENAPPTSQALLVQRTSSSCSG
jgi:hypothetical protein